MDDVLLSAGRQILGGDVAVRRAPYGTIVAHADDEWVARPVEAFGGVPATMFELSEFPEMMDRLGALRMVWAVTGDGSAYQLNDEASFSAFAAAVMPLASPVDFAILVTHFWGIGMEKVLSVDNLSDRGREALSRVRPPFGPPILTETDDGWVLDFFAAASTGKSDGTDVIYDIRRWTVRRMADGVDWQARPLLLGVAGVLAR